MPRKKFWNFKNLANNEGELDIYGEISSSNGGWFSDGTEITPTGFKEDLAALGDIDVLNVYVNSPGGDVFAGQAIYSMLKRNKATINIHVDGLAASIASVIAMAGDSIHMPSNSMMMIHNPWSIAQGNSKDFRKMADDLDKIGLSIQETYLAKASEMKSEKLVELLDNETWLTAKECMDLGLCDVVEEEKAIAASICSLEILNKFKNVPKQFTNFVTDEEKAQNKLNDLNKKRIELELEL
jgi:ATP-dependent Clp protease protease subunit